MTWQAWKRLLPDTKVLSKNTGYGKNYQVDQYASYNTSPSIWAPVSRIDDRLPVKERVLGVVTVTGQKAYPYERFAELGLLHDRIGGQEILVVWHRSAKFVTVFDPNTSAGISEFTIESADGSFPFYLRDQLTGSHWDLTGRAIEGPLAGETLRQVMASYSAFWFAWAAIWPDTELWMEDG
jgi:hypothetical protein